MILYHVSTELDKDGHFTPRFPLNIMENEKGIERICVAPTIADCFSAIPRGGSRLDELNLEQMGMYKVFRIDTEKLGIPEQAIVSWKTLFEQGWVPDAEWTEEHWITQAFIVPEEDSFVIALTNWNEESCDLIPYAIQQVADAEYEGNQLEAFESEFGEMAPCMSRIVDIEFRREPLQSGESFEIYLEFLDDQDQVNTLAKEHLGVELEVEDDGITVLKGELTMEMLAMCITGNCEALEQLNQMSGSLTVKQAIA